MHNKTIHSRWSPITSQTNLARRYGLTGLRKCWGFYLQNFEAKLSNFPAAQFSLVLGRESGQYSGSCR